MSSNLQSIYNCIINDAELLEELTEDNIFSCANWIRSEYKLDKYDSMTIARAIFAQLT